MRYSALWLLSITCFTMCTPAPGADAPVAWEEEFDAPPAPADARIFYSDKDGGDSGPDLMIRQVSDGLLRLGIRYHPALEKDEVNMVFGDPLWWPPTESGWGPFDLTTHPFVEIKWRSNAEGFTFYYAVETADGERRAGYTWPSADRTETDAAGRTWSITRFRVAPDSSAPTAATAVKLLGLNLNVRCAKSQGRPTLREDVWTQIDHIRVRGFDEQEARRERNVTAAFSAFPPARWRGLDTFFPFGVYTAGYLRSDFEFWGGDYQGAYGLFARAGLNFVAANDEVELGRFGGQQSDAGLASYIEEMKRHVAWARDSGIRLAADVRRMMDTRDPYDGHGQLLPITRRLAEAFADDDTVIAWKLADEPGANRILEYGMMIRALRESDPLQRPELIVFNNVGAFKPYAAYSQIAYWDQYPGHNVWAIRDTARAYQGAAGAKPVWAVLQAFETRPPANGVYERTSDAETRMMTYLALAEGAKGLVWFSGWSGSGRDEGMITRTGRPQGHWLHTLRDLSRVLVPIGRQLLATEPAALIRRASIKKGDVPVKVYDFGAPDGPDATRVEITDHTLPMSLIRRADGHGVEVSLLRHRAEPMFYLVVVNEDLEATRRADVGLPAALLGAGVFDLHTLDGSDLLHGTTFTTTPLAGGDGRIYLVAAPGAHEAVANAIRCDRARERVRVLLPDLGLARRWQLPVDDVRAAVAACRAAADRGDAAEAAGHAARAHEALAAVTAAHSEFNVTRHMLDEIARELDEVVRIAEIDSLEPRWWTGRDHPMMVPNPNHLKLAEAYWTVGRSYRDLRARFVRGESAGLAGAVFKLRIQCLQMRDALLGMLRARSKSEQEQAGE